MSKHELVIAFCLQMHARDLGRRLFVYIVNHQIVPTHGSIDISFIVNLNECLAKTANKVGNHCINICKISRIDSANPE